MDQMKFYLNVKSFKYIFFPMPEEYIFSYDYSCFRYGICFKITYFFKNFIGQISYLIY